MQCVWIIQKCFVERKEEIEKNEWKKSLTSNSFVRNDAYLDICSNEHKTLWVISLVAISIYAVKCVHRTFDKNKCYIVDFIQYSPQYELWAPFVLRLLSSFVIQPFWPYLLNSTIWTHDAYVNRASHSFS